MKRTYMEIFSSFFGWIIYLSAYLALSVVTLSIVQGIKSGINPWLGIPVFIKWEIFIIVFSFSLANVVYFWQKFVQKFLIFGGLLRISIIVALSYIITSAIYPYAMFPFARFAYVLVEEIESSLVFMMIILVIFRIFPQRYYSNPDGPTFQKPVDKTDNVIPFGVFHPGIDFSLNWGSPVYAVEDGKIITSWPYSIYGNMVKISHENGWSTVYGQLSKITVNRGQSVKKGDLIGYIGSTGYAFNPHLHFEVRYKNKVVDPEDYLEGMTEKGETSKNKIHQKRKAENKVYKNKTKK